MTKGRINLEDVMILNWNEFYSIFPKYVKQKVTKFLKKLQWKILIKHSQIIGKSNG